MPKKGKQENLDKPKIKITNVDDKPQKPPKEMKKRNRKSNFFLTINTNQKFNPHSEEYEKFNVNFKKSLNEIYQNIQNYITIGEKESNFDNNVHEVDIKSATEIGPKTGSSHAHIMLGFKHNTLVKLDYPKIKEKIQNDLNLIL